MTPETFYIPGNPELVASGKAVILSGCSGGGKSTLLAALSQRGHAVREEAGRQVVQEQLHLGGDGLPWLDALKFVELAASRTIYMFNTCHAAGQCVFFDRALVDLVSFLDLKRIAVPDYLRQAVSVYRYAPSVFITPPWREIYVNEAERSKSFEDACLEYDALTVAYATAGYELVEVPRLAVAERAHFIVSRL